MNLYDQSLYVDSRAWGCHMWQYLHIFAAAFDPAYPVDAPGLFAKIAETLPCPVCRTHAKKYIDEHPVPTETRESLVAYVNDMHNTVSKRLGKKEYALKDSIRETNKTISGSLAKAAPGASGSPPWLWPAGAALVLGAVAYAGYRMGKKASSRG